MSAKPGGTARKARIESVALRALDRRRVDVAVDIVPASAPLSVELVIVGPQGRELCSALVVRFEGRTLDRMLHLRQDAVCGSHTLHVGLLQEDQVVDKAARAFVFPDDTRPKGG